MYSLVDLCLTAGTNQPGYFYLKYSCKKIYKYFFQAVKAYYEQCIKFNTKSKQVMDFYKAGINRQLSELAKPTFIIPFKSIQCRENTSKDRFLTC